MPTQNSSPTTHPRIDRFTELNQLTEPARSLGYRLPAEFEPQQSILLTTPHNTETWPSGTIEKAQTEHAYFAEQLAKAAPVITTQSLNLPTNDSWIRDFGPLTVTRKPFTSWQPQNSSPNQPLNQLAIHDFNFNGWGNKYEEKTHDNLIPQHIAYQHNLPIFIHDLVFEGGSIDVNGQGLALTTIQCLLNQNRNAHLTQSDIVFFLQDAFNLDHIIFLPGGITGDDTDGHIDDIARFINTDTVVIAAAPPHHPDHDILLENKKILKKNKLNILPLPTPDPIYFDFPGDRFMKAERLMLPASYANFLISNGHLYLPTFNQPTDDLAIRALENAMPDYNIIPIPSSHLISGLGALHCLSMQIPY
ncbi:agmatine deiminase family protein [Poriferisphaera sp. WC338]|uniref:agmatine deiminase family protein n=1 Tax=Poriferisphaera sp. WC338 TaxID=3425129 RepID=UPI003D81864E